MSFSGLHVVAGYAGGRGFLHSTQALLSHITWSEDPASITTGVAPAFNDRYGEPVFRLEAAADSWVSIGPNPNASTGTRFLVRATTSAPYDIYATPGDKLAWIAA